VLDVSWKMEIEHKGKKFRLAHEVELLEIQYNELDLCDRPEVHSVIQIFDDYRRRTEHAPNLRGDAPMLQRYKKLEERIAHLRGQLTQEVHRKETGEVRLLSAQECVTVKHFRAALNVPDYTLRRVPKVLPTDGDIITFIAHKWDGKVPFWEKDRQPLLDLLDKFHPGELIWVDFLDGSTKSGYQLADFPRWILSCHTRIIVPGDMQLFRCSPWCVCELLMCKPSHVIGYDMAQFFVEVFDESKPVVLRQIQDKQEVNEFLQCLMLALVGADQELASYAKGLLKQYLNGTIPLSFPNRA
jgi:hypothetical protein